MPSRWALREDESGKLILIARNHDHDHWRDVAASTGMSSLMELIVERLNKSDQG